MNNSFEKLATYLENKPKPPVQIKKVIQVLLVRTTAENVVLRTESGGTLNTDYVPLDTRPDSGMVSRVLFLAEKQKATENRHFAQLIQTAAEMNGVSIHECYLKDNLCLECPRCVLFGASSVYNKTDNINIKHRVTYSDSFSLLPTEQIIRTQTFNSVDDMRQNVGQALNTMDVVRPGAMFPSIVTLVSATRDELVLMLKTLMSKLQYGGNTRVAGHFTNTITGIIASTDEVITSLEYTQALYEMRDDKSALQEKTASILRRYNATAPTPSNAVIFSPQEVEDLLKAVREVALDKEFVQRIYKDSAEYRKIQKTAK